MKELRKSELRRKIRQAYCVQGHEYYLLASIRKKHGENMRHSIELLKINAILNLISQDFLFPYATANSVKLIAFVTHVLNRRSSEGGKSLSITEEMASPKQANNTIKKKSKMFGKTSARFYRRNTAKIGRLWCADLL